MESNSRRLGRRSSGSPPRGRSSLGTPSSAEAAASCRSARLPGSFRKAGIRSSSSPRFSASSTSRSSWCLCHTASQCSTTPARRSNARWLAERQACPPELRPKREQKREKRDEEEGDLHYEEE